jgi:hypothetical protein
MDHTELLLEDESQVETFILPTQRKRLCHVPNIYRCRANATARRSASRAGLREDRVVAAFSGCCRVDRYVS